jgi:hypothetical protein
MQREVKEILRTSGLSRRIRRWPKKKGFNRAFFKKMYPYFKHFNFHKTWNFYSSSRNRSFIRS